MKTKQRNFNRQHLGFALGTALCVTLTTFPVVAYHYWLTLTGFALLAIVGLVFADFILWYCAVWSSTTKSGWLKYVSLAAKVVLSLVMIFNAAVVVYVMRHDRLNEKAAQTHLQELEKRAELAERLRNRTGDRRLARDVLKNEPIQGTSRPKLEEELIPKWYSEFGIYLLPTLCALILGAGVYLTGMIYKTEESEETLSGAAPTGTWPPASHNVTNGPPEPRTFWPGPQIIKGAADEAGFPKQQRR